MFFDSSHYYFKLSKKETINVSFVYHYHHFDYSTLLLKLKLDGEKYIDFKSIEAILIECLNKNNVILKKGNGESMKIIFKLMNNKGEINLNKENMTEEQKFEKVLNEIKDLKNINEDKIEEIKKSSKEIEEYVEKKCKENKIELEKLDKEVDKNKEDIDNQKKELDELNEALEDIKEKIKNNKAIIKNNNNNNNNNNGSRTDCSVF